MKRPIICAFILLASAAGCQKSNVDNSETAGGTAAPPTVNVRTAPVTSQSFRKTIETTGTVAFDQNHTTQILAPISGPVSRIVVGIGSRVRRGQALALVSSPDFAAGISSLRKAQATASNARRIATLDEQLFKTDAIARRDLEQAETDAVNAEADRDAAAQELRSLGVDARTIAAIGQNRPPGSVDGVIRSPIDGTVVEKLVSPGQLLQAGTTPTFTVTDLSTVWVEANVFEADLASVRVGDQADVITGSGQTVRGQVEYIAALVDPNTRSVAVRITVPNPGELLKRDLYARVILHSGAAADGILIPVSAVLRDDENLPFVFVEKPDGTFERRRVDAGSRVGDLQEIRSGLQTGESIVVEGGLFLQNEEHS